VEREHAARDRLLDRKDPLESGPIGRGRRQWDPHDRRRPRLHQRVRTARGAGCGLR
jgi:hypothetical protein